MVKGLGGGLRESNGNLNFYTPNKIDDFRIKANSDAETVINLRSEGKGNAQEAQDAFKAYYNYPIEVDANYVGNLVEKENMR